MSNFYIASSRELSNDFWSNLADYGAIEQDCIKSPEELETLSTQLTSRSRIFFPHWNWIVPKHIHTMHDCIMFHMTDLPFGRGGSPLQNLILTGHDQTVISAFRCEDGLDSGPVYSKIPLSLSGRAQEILKRADIAISHQIVDLIEEIAEPIPQAGEPTFFVRRKPEQSAISETSDLGELFNLIRALDAPGYRKANLRYGDLTYFFSDAVLENDELRASVRITPESE